jgi:dihydropyrimidinase
MPGIGARLPLGFGLLAPEQLVEVACAAPARIFGLYPRKGVIAAGSDADIVVWDPSAPAPLTLDLINDGLDWSPYEDMRVPGSIRHVLAGGDHVVVDGRFGGDGHRGRYLPVSRVLETA